MMMNGGEEIPPLDNAVDIARPDEAQPMEDVANARYWPGFVLLLIGLAATAISIIASIADIRGLAIAGALLAAIFLIAGGILTIAERWRLRGARIGGQAVGTTLPLWRSRSDVGVRNGAFRGHI